MIELTSLNNSQHTASMEYAESLGLGVFCSCQIVVLLVWDHEIACRLDENDEQVYRETVQCHLCNSLYKVPSQGEVDDFHE